jgi:hypothetical protein
MFHQQTILYLYHVHTNITFYDKFHDIASLHNKRQIYIILTNLEPATNCSRAAKPNEFFHTQKLPIHNANSQFGDNILNSKLGMPTT